MSEPTEPVARAIALLESQHTVPGPFEFRVVIRPQHRDDVLKVLVATAGGAETLIALSERPSSHGNYLALRVTVQLSDASVVLAVYDVIRKTEGVLTVM